MRPSFQGTPVIRNVLATRGPGRPDCIDSYGIISSLEETVVEKKDLMKTVNSSSQQILKDPQKVCP